MRHRRVPGEGDAWEKFHGKSEKPGKGADAKRMTAKRERREDRQVVADELDGGFVASSTSVPGAVAQGETVEEAEAALDAVLEDIAAVEMYGDYRRRWAIGMRNPALNGYSGQWVAVADGVVVAAAPTSLELVPEVKKLNDDVQSRAVAQYAHGPDDPVWMGWWS